MVHEFELFSSTQFVRRKICTQWNLSLQAFLFDLLIRSCLQLTTSEWHLSVINRMHVRTKFSRKLVNSFEVSFFHLVCTSDTPFLFLGTS